MTQFKNTNKIRIILFGSPEFSLPSFEAILADPHFQIVAVFTQSDKTSGRKNKIKAPAVKIWAKKNKLTIYQPEKIKTEFELLKSLKPDLILVMAYGQIIPLEILELPKYKSINVHASLLPKYRGAACLNASILNQDIETGLSFMIMDAGLDTGDIIKQIKSPLDKRETLSTLHDKLAKLSAYHITHVLHNYISGNLKPYKQDNSLASYVPRLKKIDGLLNWHLSAQELDHQIRALNPWPGTFSFIKIKGKYRLIKILKAEVDWEINKITQDRLVGTIYTENQKLKISCGQNNLNILKLQIEGSGILSFKEFLSGYPYLLEQVLSSDKNLM